MPAQFDREKTKKNMKVILNTMYTDTDVSLLQEYRRIFKKEVSLFRRSWAAAWLLMYYDQRETPKEIPGEFDSKPAGRKFLPLKREKPVVEINLSEEESKRLFISIGKNRRLFPREIITLIMSKTSAAREDIGAIRILDNYSFVQVRDTKSDEIIETLTGHKFRGRTLTVNYAKSKTSDSDESQ